MAKKNDHPSQGHSADAGNPQQFRLIDLFALTTLVALVSAVVAPLFRRLESNFRYLLLLVVGLQLLITVGTIVYYAKKRKKLLDKTGSKIGAGYCGQFRWRYWPIARTLFTVILEVLFLILFSFAIAYSLVDHGEIIGPISMMIDRLPFSHRVLHYLHYLSFLDYLLYVRSSFKVGYAFSFLRWQAYPNTMEFFKNGIVRNGLFFMSWKSIEVRPSAFFNDKIAIVVRASSLAIEDRPSPDSLDSKDTARGSLDTVVGTITMAQVSNELRAKVFAAAEARRVSNDNGTLAPERIH